MINLNFKKHIITMQVNEILISIVIWKKIMELEIQHQLSSLL